MTTRTRKNLLLSALKLRALAAKMRPEEVAGFEGMYRRARTPGEQDQVTEALRAFVGGWQEGDDDFSRLLRLANDFDDFLCDDEDRLPPALEEAIARARVDVRAR
jgi:hypothetical protein